MQKIGVEYHYEDEKGRPVIGGKINPGPISVGMFVNPQGEPLVTIGDRAICTVDQFKEGLVYLVDLYLAAPVSRYQKTLASHLPIDGQTCQALEMSRRLESQVLELLARVQSLEVNSPQGSARLRS